MNHNSFETSHNVTLTLAVGLIFTFGLNFDYLMVRGNTLESTHKAKYRLKIDKSFTPLGEFHHQPIYDGVKFNVSMAAFSKGDSIILMHAEMHTDGSGGLDYSKLKAETLNGIKFTSREQCVTPADVPDSNPELLFLRDKGVAVVFPMYLKQFFATSPDGTSEVVLTYYKRVVSCGSETIASEFKEQIDREVRSLMRVSKKK